MHGPPLKGLDSNEEIRSRVERLLGQEPPKIKKNVILLTRLREHICTVPPEGASEREEEFIASACI